MTGEKKQVAKNSISILGCGWLGLALGKSLAKDSFNVKGSTTHVEKLTKISSLDIEAWHLNMSDTGNNASGFFNTDVVVITVPPSAKDYLTTMAKTIAAIEANDVKKVIFISTTAVYPDLNRVVFEEDAHPEACSRSGIRLLEIEDTFRTNKNFSASILRFGGLYGPQRQPGRFLSGRKGMKGPNAPVNLIHRDDCIGIIKAVLEKDLWGETFNACAPQHPQRKLFYTKACEALKLPPPEFENNPASFKIISSKRLVDALDYTFTHPDPLLDL